MVTDQLGKAIELRLIEGKNTHFIDFLTFYVETNEKSGIKRPCVSINGSLKISTNFKQSNIKPCKTEGQEIFVDIASALMLEPTFV